MKDYPKYSGKETLLKYKKVKCTFCDERSTHKTTWKISVFRGDDHVFHVCKDHIKNYIDLQK